MNISFNKPYLAGREIENIRACFERGHTASGGFFTRKCEELLRETLACKEVLLTTSCTDALEMSALLLDLQPGDEVIVPSFAFVSTANAFAIHGARIRFADVCPFTLNLSVSSVERCLSERTRAIVPLHYAGAGCDMAPLLDICTKTGCELIEDNAHALFAKRDGVYLGTSGRFGTLSFHETKNFSCGEGGALICNSTDDLDRAHTLRDKGTNRRKFFRGETDKYTWVDLGSSFAPSDLLAAFLLAQLEEREAILRLRSALWKRYRIELSSWAAENEIQLPRQLPEGESSHHIFWLLLQTEEEQKSFIRYLRQRNILAVFHYQPLHSSPMGKKFFTPEDEACPVSTDVAGRLVRLPLFNGMTHDQQDFVVETILAYPRSQ